MKETPGDLLALAAAGEFDVIVHGCNCFCAMGAGIAKQIARTFPAAAAADLATAKGDRAKLGSLTTAAVACAGGHELVVVNGYTQYGTRRAPNSPFAVDYGAVRDVFRKVKEDYAGMRIAFPLIGAGLAGGDWNTIAAIIDEELQGEDATLVRFAP